MLYMGECLRQLNYHPICVHVDLLDHDHSVLEDFIASPI